MTLETFYHICFMPQDTSTVYGDFTGERQRKLDKTLMVCGKETTLLYLRQYMPEKK